MAQLQCIVVTPEETALDEVVEFVALPLYDGEIGIFPRHSPLIGRLGCGEMRLKGSGQTSRHYIDGGFVQISDNIVTVLTSRAIPAGEIDTTVAQAQLDEAHSSRAHSVELMEARDKAVTQARAQMRVASRGE